MKRILVASDFSPGADRALRRATLIARAHGARIVLAHALGDRSADDNGSDAAALLARLAATVREVDGVPCETRITDGGAPESIAALAAETDADVVVTGPPRREMLRNLFVGTTAGRSARAGQLPVIVAAGLPVDTYRQILFATDLSADSAAALEAARDLGLLEGARLAAFHAFVAPAKGLMLRSTIPQDTVTAYLDEETAQARSELAAFLAGAGIDAAELIVDPIEVDAAQAVRAAARRIRADLVVIGAGGGSALETLFLGSVAAQLLVSPDVDFLVAPPNPTPASADMISDDPGP